MGTWVYKTDMSPEKPLDDPRWVYYETDRQTRNDAVMLRAPRLIQVAEVTDGVVKGSDGEYYGCGTTDITVGQLIFVVACSPWDHQHGNIVAWDWIAVPVEDAPEYDLRCYLREDE